MTVSAMAVSTMERPRPLIWAVALIVVGAIANLATLPLIPDDAPAAVLPILIALSVAWLVGAWGGGGVWQASKLAAIFVFVVTVLNGLASLPGIFFAEDESAAMQLTFRIGAAVGTVHAIAVCWLLVVKSARDALR